MGVAGKDFEELKAGTPQFFHLWNVFGPYMGTQSKIRQGAILEMSDRMLQEAGIGDGMAVGVLNDRRDPTYSSGAGTQGVLPYLPLPELQKRGAGGAQ